MPDQMNAADAGIDNPHDFAQAVLRALGLQDMRHVLALELSIPGAGCVPVVKISRALTKGETRELALAIETQRFKLVPDGQPEHDGFDPDSCESTPVGKMVSVQPLRRRFAVTLPLADHGPAWAPLNAPIRSVATIARSWRMRFMRFGFGSGMPARAC